MNNRIIPLNLTMAGPGVHEKMGNDPEKLFSGDGETDTWSIEEKTDLGIYAGFWAASVSMAKVNYKEWEYFHFLEGSASITNRHGKTWEIGTESGVIIPAGFKGDWHTTKKILKQYVIIAPPTSLLQQRENSANPDEIIILDNNNPAAPKPMTEATPKEKLLSGEMMTKTWDFFHTDTKPNIDCGLWSCSIGKRKTLHAGYWEFCHFLKGSATISNTAGETWHFKKGDGFIIPKDFEGSWETTAELLKEYVIITG